MTVQYISPRNWVYNSVHSITLGDVEEIYNKILHDRAQATKGRRVYSLTFIHGLVSEEEAEFIGDSLLYELDTSIPISYIIDRSKIVEGSYALFIKTQGTGKWLNSKTIPIDTESEKK